MVAIDQRDSLRAMFQAKQTGAVADELLRDFKVAVAETLGGTASAMLFDRHYGLPGLARLGERHPVCGRILAVDLLIQEPGKPVSDTELDDVLDGTAIREQGVVALKFLLLWKGQKSADRCRRLALRFMAYCRANGFLGVLEAMVRPPEQADASQWDREQALLDAASVLAEARPDLYKGEVPFVGRGDGQAITQSCAAISQVLSCPWVVLSQGVAAADFPIAVRAACEGGASGFLAGRAIWADIIGPGDYRTRLQANALPRLSALTEIVDAAARPWRSVKASN
jgi:sulfofructosephosphate aldolase